MKLLYKFVFLCLYCFSGYLAAETITIINTPPSGTPVQNVVDKNIGERLRIIVKPKEGLLGVIKIDGQTVATGAVNSVVRYQYTVSGNAIIDISYIADDENNLSSGASITPIGLGESINVTNQATVVIAGVAQAAEGIDRVEVFNETTETTLVAAGTNEWSAQVTLNEGDNKLIFTVFSTDGVTQSDYETTITYFPTLSFSSALVLSSEIAYVNETKSIVANIGMQSSAIPNISTIALYHSDQDGIIGTKVADMFDNGVLPDEIDHDSIYSTSFDLLSETEGFSCYRVEVVTTDELTSYSENKCIFVSSHYTQQQLIDAIALTNLAETTYTQSIEQGKSLQEAANDAVAALQQSSEVAQVAATEEGGVWWINQSGMLGLYHPYKENSKAGGGGSSANGGQAVVETETPVIAPEYRVSHYPASFLYQPVKTKAKTSLATLAAPLVEENRIKSNKGILISPYIQNPNDLANSFGQGDDFFVPWQTIVNQNSCNLIADTAVVNNGSINVSLDTFKNLSDYGYIHISTHGDNFYSGLLNLWSEEWGTNDWLKGSLSQVVLFTGIVLPTVEGVVDVTGYEDDLKNHYIALSSDGSVVVLPAFFKAYLPSLPNSLVVLAACRTMYNNSLANVFKAKGAGAVLGYSDYVLTSYAQNTTNTVITELFKDKTIKEAFSTAVSTWGANDGQANSPAAFLRLGSDDLKLSSGEIKNASFEDGVLTPWHAIGDGRVISSLGSGMPTDGFYMGIISTGLGFTDQSGSIEQNACIPAASAPSTVQMSFDWRFYSEEFLEYCGSQYQDSFSVEICEVDNTNGSESNCSVLHSRIVDDLCASVSESDVSFDEGGVYDTGWISTTSDISAYQGKSAKIRFGASDVGDSIYDTAVLIDNIKIITPSQ